MDKDTIICSCRDIKVKEIEEAIDLGIQSFDDLKRITTCGMGACQSKVCFDLVAQIISKKQNIPLNEIKHSKMRTPLRMLPLRALAGQGNEGHTQVDEGEKV